MATVKKVNKDVDFKRMLIQEYKKCVKEPDYFLRKYCYIQHPMRGKIKFDLYPFQEEVLRNFRDHQNVIVLKSRQLGISTLAAGYSLWLILFHRDKNVLCLATTQATARNLVSKTIFMYESLPKWLKVPFKEKNKLSMRLTNGSKIEAKSSNESAARSEAVSFLCVDEAAFIDNIEETYAAAQQTLATGGQSMLLSTPNGVGNFFYKTWIKAENGENTFFPIRLPWTVHPERNQEWRDKQTKDLGKRFASQECDCSFLTSGNTVVEPELLNEIEKETIKEPDDKRGFDGNLWIWLEPDYTRSYLITADVARGDGEDYSACHVFDVETCEQVAEYKGQLGPRDYGRFLLSLGKLYNTALVSVENASIGWSTIEEIIEQGYPNLYYGTSNTFETVESYNVKWDKDKLTPGFTNSARTRPILVAKIIEYIEGKSCTIHSKRLLSELRTFIWGNGGKAEAAQGFHDDLVMAFGQALYIRDTALRMRRQGQDLIKNSMDSFLNLNKRDPSFYTAPRVTDPYKMDIGNNQQIDFSWVLG